MEVGKLCIAGKGRGIGEFRVSDRIRNGAVIGVAHELVNQQQRGSCVCDSWAGLGV